ncbi:Stp1/IreP family PP2C-type Ser/Thr phosphatase [Macrococcoides caseolyticum]|uniref:Stp1/IreP family PP2C-type Ser/Thr phosphatase n=1 Tax=Macrococcoides caseolyticum TaxID=69966 RepID=UPI001F3E1C6B|nr:Stp1/IreP family PP2C-type Ser/Thr phosphatase [Macrococcus caseolyticus]MCE4956798.1 Stp1/IreP family PP2C-type Ser/Thr phosphatase [Macrococcus caseolyticus]
MHARFFTDMGPVRTRNEDAGGVYYNHTGQMLVVICDGMGGHNSGDIASKFVNDLIKARFCSENYIEQSNAEHWLKMNISDINRQLYQQSHQNNEHQGMGTTLVCALLFDHHVVIANVGDSRAYLIHHSEIRQVTHDHTFVNHLLMAGGLTKEEAKHHPQRNVITKVIGSDKRIHPDMFEYDYDRYQYLLLTSDGLTDYLEETFIHEMIYAHDTVKAAGEALIEAAVKAGARDNISLVLVPLKGGE